MTALTDGIQRGARFDSTGRYRYWLTRAWGGGATCVFVMLNPSIADATRDDATIRRCIGFARRWGAGRMIAVNLFAFRATDPRDLACASEPIGPGNDRALARAAGEGDILVAAWGAHGRMMGRGALVARRLTETAAAPVQCLGLTAEGQPRHPLRLAASTRRRPLVNVQ